LPLRGEELDVAMAVADWRRRATRRSLSSLRDDDMHNPTALEL